MITREAMFPPALVHDGSVSETCLFCEIAGDRVAASRVYEDDEFVAFLDHRPLFAGHTLVVPRVHYETLTDLPPVHTGPLFGLVQRMCVAVGRAAQAEGTFVAVNNRISQSVPHLHVHVVPRRPKDGLKGFFWPRTKYRDAEEMEAMRAAIASALG
jgi:histidine triad (HIT) family protein